MAVPGPGTYRVTVVLGGWETATELTVFLGRRRCVLLNRPVQVGECLTLSRVETLGPIVPRGQESPADVTGVDVTVTGGPWIESVSVEAAPAAPSLHIAGDSTVTDQPADPPYDPASTYCGWGQMLPLFLTGGVGVGNHAHSGLTTESFRTGGHWSLMEAALRPGDLALFQFGHNDQKLLHLDAMGGYAANLRRYVAETKVRGALPVLVSPVSRSLWNGPGGSFNDLLAPWARACEVVAAETQVPFVDLHGASVAQILAWGREGARPYFHPGDYTHHNDFGGWHMAGLVHRALVEALPSYRSWWASAPAGFFPPPAASSTPVAHRYTAPASLPSVPEDDRPSGPLTRVEFLVRLLSAARLLPCQVYNDAWTDVFGDEWFAGSLQTVFDQGLWDPRWAPEGRFDPHQPVSGAQMVEVAVRTARVKGRPGVSVADFDPGADPSALLGRLVQLLGEGPSAEAPSQPAQA